MAINHNKGIKPQTKEYRFIRHPVRYTKQRYQNVRQKTYKAAGYIINNEQENDQRNRERSKNLGTSLIGLIIVMVIILGFFKLIGWV